MANIARTVDRPWNILQRMDVGVDFSGVAPGDGVDPLVPTVDAYSTFVYASAAEAGLFDPTSALHTFRRSEPLALVGVELTLGTQSAWDVSLVDAGAREYLIYSGTSETSFAKGWGDEIVLTWGQKLKVTTTGAGGADLLVASIKLAPIHFFNGGR